MEPEREKTCSCRCCLDGWKCGRDERGPLQSWHDLAEDSRADSGAVRPGRESDSGPSNSAAHQRRTRNANSHASAYGNIDTPSDIGSNCNSKINAESDAKASSSDTETNAKEARREGFTHAATFGNTAGQERLGD